MSSYHHNMSALQANANLHCAQCESQIGIFENEWIRLTSSYARSKEKGTHFGTEVGHRTQIVPSGPAQRSAEGCAMAEVFCRKCSNMVGQYCKSAPDAEKQPLVAQYFYKLSRTFLKDSRTSTRVDPVFGYGSDIVKTTPSKPTPVPRLGMPPTSRWADTPLRQSSRTPASSAYGARDSLLPHGQESSATSPEVEDKKWQYTLAEIQQLREEIAMQRAATQEQLSQIAMQNKRSDDQEARFREQDVTIEELENCVSAQAAQIAEQKALIDEHKRRIESQRYQLAPITSRLTRLQNSMKQLKETLGHTERSFTATPQSGTGQTTADVALGTVIEDGYNVQERAKDIEVLRSEHQAMKSKLDTIMTAIGGIANFNTLALAQSTDTPILGKRKRNPVGRPQLSDSVREKYSENAVVRSRTNAAQMPTPQSSDSGQQSPEQTPSTTIARTSGEYKAGGQPERFLPSEHAKLSNQNGVARAEQATITDEAIASHVTGDVDPSAPKDQSLQPNAQITADALKDKSPTENNVASSSTAPVGRKSRPSKSLTASSILDADDEVLVLSASHSSNRRMTRASTRAVQPIQTPSDRQKDLEMTGVQPSSSVKTPLPSGQSPSQRSDSRSHIESALPSVQTASNILVVNLEAPRESSQALKQQLDAGKSEQVQEHGAGIVTTDRIAPGELSVMSGDSVPTKDAQTGRFHFIQVSGTDDVRDNDDGEDDNQDDDVDDFMQSNTTVYGDDGWDAESSGSMGQHEDDTAPHGEQNLTPEPTQERDTTKTHQLITLNGIHIATPTMFAERSTPEFDPEQAHSPRVMQECILDNELRRLGLSHWIGKPKMSNKEYRAAVSAARARQRDLKKAALLRSRGIHHDLPELSPVLSENAARHLDSDLHHMPLSTIENLPAGPTAATQCVSDHDIQRDDEGHPKSDRRTTRARTRRTGLQLLTGLEEVEDYSRTSGSEATSRKRRSGGKRKSERISGVACDKEETQAVAGLEAADEELVLDEMTDSLGSDSAYEPPGNTKRRSTGRPGRKSRRFTDADLSAIDDAFEPVEVSHDDEHVPLNPPEASAQVPQMRMVDVTSGPSMQSSTKQHLGPGSQAQQREEAILQRDRMARELMEREDMDMWFGE